MKKRNRILLAASVGIILLMIVWPRLAHGIYVTDFSKMFGDIVAILLVVFGALLVSYAAHEIHAASVPLLWSTFFLYPLVRFLFGNSDGLMADLAMIIMMGIPGTWLLIISIRMFWRARQRAVK